MSPKNDIFYFVLHRAKRSQGYVRQNDLTRNMEDRKQDHTYTHNTTQKHEVSVIKKDRKKDHTYSKGVTLTTEEIAERISTSREFNIKSEDQDGSQSKQKQDHSYSVMDKPKFAHREKHENKVQLPYPLKGDHEYVRGKPNTKEIIVSNFHVSHNVTK